MKSRYFSVVCLLCKGKGFTVYFDIQDVEKCEACEGTGKIELSPEKKEWYARPIAQETY